MGSTKIAVVALALLLAGCGSESTTGQDSKTPEQPVQETSAVAGTTATSANPVLPGASVTPQKREPQGEDIALHTDVRVARQSGFDRLVFEFRGNSVPGYTVRYVERPVVEDGSGRSVAVEGEEVLSVRMVNALDADLTDDDAPATYTGPARLQPDGTAEIVEVARVGGFEGILTWAVGLRNRAPFQVTELRDPPRLVIDVLHS